MSPADLADRIRGVLARRGGVELAILFGSRARGNARPDSDVDLAVDAPGSDLLDLGADLARSLDSEVDVVSLADVSIPLAEGLLRDGVVVHEAHRGAGATWRSHLLTTMETDRPFYARMREAWLRRVAILGLPHG